MAVKLKYTLTALIAALLCWIGYRFDRRMTHSCTWQCSEDCR